MQIFEPIELCDAYALFGVFIPKELDFEVEEIQELYTDEPINLDTVAQYSIWTYNDIPKYDILTGAEDPYDLL